MKKTTIRTLRSLKESGQKAAAVTCYDYPSAVFASEMDWILIGDSGGMCALGYGNTMPVTMADMMHFTRAVCRAKPSAFVVGDMPFGTYQVSDQEAVRNAIEFMRAGCDAVKLEGGERVASRIKAIVDAGIPVMGHLGMTPQSLSAMGGYRVCGKTEESLTQLRKDAKAVEDAGAFAILLEAMPEQPASVIVNERYCLVYGIGAGSKTDGQLLIWHDVMGCFVGDITPKFAKQYANLKSVIAQALEQYRSEVKEGAFPGPEHCYQ
jgi:3-methyl-2-oxobutanoate hydroxymethyltransferase